MKKLVFLFLSLLTAGSLFQACDDSKTYAEMLEDEKNAVERFIRDSAITVISLDEFKRNDSITNVDKNEYVFFSNDGIYMQIVKGGKYDPDDKDKNKFEDNDNICVRYLEKNVDTRELAAFNVPLEEFMDAGKLYANPEVFRYVNKDTYSAGTFISTSYVWASYYSTTAVPQGWLLALPYLRDDSYVRLIVPSKMGHQSAQQYVTPYFYELKFQKAKS